MVWQFYKLPIFMQLQYSFAVLFRGQIRFTKNSKIVRRCDKDVVLNFIETEIQGLLIA